MKPRLIIILFALGLITCTKNQDLNNAVDPQVELKSPSELVVTNMTETTISFKWKNNNTITNADTSAKNIIEQSLDNVNFITATIVQIDSTTTTVVGSYLTTNTYYFRVKAKTQFKISNYSNVATYQLSFPAPSNTRINSLTASQAVITWSDNSSFETGFEIEQSVNEGVFTLVKTVDANITSALIISAFDHSAKYSFRVKAITTTNSSLYSTSPNSTISEIAGLVIIEGGTFTMGSPTGVGSTDEQPPHSVTLYDYYLSRTEIRWGMWDTVYQWAKNNGYTDLPAGRKGYNGDANHPVTEVNWYDIVKWCNARSQKEGLPPIYYTDSNFIAIYKTSETDLQNIMVNWKANGYRLPTEAEWEYAARGGNMSRGFSYSGSIILDSIGWYNDNSISNTHTAGTKAPNELGLYDMSGNVYEFCWDWYGTYPSTAQTNPYGPITGMYRILRGGSFTVGDYNCRVALRSHHDLPNKREINFGFRCVKNK